MSTSTPTTDYETTLRQAEEREAEALDAVVQAKARLRRARQALQQVRAQRPPTPYEAAGQLTADEARRVAEAEELLQAAERARNEATAHLWSLSAIRRSEGGDLQLTGQKHNVTKAEYDAALHARGEAQQAAEAARLRWNEVNMAVTAARQARRVAVNRAEAEAIRQRQAATTTRARQAEALRQRLGIGRG